MASILRKTHFNLEAPALNEEAAVDLHPRSLARDEHLKDFQNLTVAALSEASSVLNMILRTQRRRR